MPIRAHLSDKSAFEPEAIQAMSTALELSCADLGILAGDHHDRQVIAARIIDLARDGIVDASVLHQRVIAEARIRA